jgi:dynein heavy chain, axonemal
MSEEIAPQELDFFLRFPTAQHISSPVEFLSNSSWSGVRSLSTKDEFRYFKNIQIDQIVKSLNSY